tara:strand:+ start:7126 stop:7689 length:564 start_codon:yes stop_codon:yes gene_type:complete
MKAKEALEQIKSLLFADEAVITEEVETEFAEGILADGTIVKFDKLEVGGLVSVVTPDGEVPAPVGEHELEDGTVIVIAEAGVISEVRLVEMLDEVIVEEEMAIEPVNYDSKFEEISQLYNSKFSEVEARINSLNDITKKIVEFMDAFAQVESAVETQKPKNTFLAQNKVSKVDAYKNLQNIFQTIKN